MPSASPGRRLQALLRQAEARKLRKTTGFDWWRNKHKSICFFLLDLNVQVFFFGMGGLCVGFIRLLFGFGLGGTN